MSYRLDKTDIVIEGFSDGIADSPYKGISDIRNVDLISIPGEASVAFSTSLSSQANIASTTFTASSSGGLLLTWSGSTSLLTNTAITVSNSGGALPTGLTANVPYYVLSVSPTTFNLATTAGGSAIAYTNSGSGTNSFATINIAQPKFLVSQAYNNTSSKASGYLYFGIDSMGRIWYYYNYSGSLFQWVYCNNLGGDETNAGVTDNGNGLVAWTPQISSPTASTNAGYLLFFRIANIGYAQTLQTSGVPQTITTLTTAATWHRTWFNTASTGNYDVTTSHYAMTGATDNVVYFCNGSYVGTLRQNSIGTAFDPTQTNGTTYTISETSLALPANEIAQCIAQLGTNVLIGGIQNIVYSWDRISVGYLPIFIAENNIPRIVTTNTTAYFFAGQRGRIYKCNGSQAALLKKMPDHLSGTTNPYYTWGDAMTSRNQLYFGISATDNAGTAINNYGGVWAIDLDSEALRLVNQLSYGSYAGIASALVALKGPTTSDGFGLLMGWYTSSNTTGGIDKGSSTPYTSGQSYVDSDLIPVGTFLKPMTPSQVEWKTSVPLVSGESVALYYRLKFSDSYTLINSTSTVGAFSDNYVTNFENAQWAQLRAVLTSTASTPSYCRLTEFRIRDYIK